MIRKKSVGCVKAASVAVTSEFLSEKSTQVQDQVRVLVLVCWWITDVEERGQK